MKTLIWILAFILTISAAVYQRLTGPTYPVKTEVISDGQKYPLTLFRSHAGQTDCPIAIQIADIRVKGNLHYRKYPTQDGMTTVELKREGDKLIGALPNQPPAGKLEYKIELTKDGSPISVSNGKPVIIRFTGEVPHIVLGVHIFLMFLAMFLSNATGMFALFKKSNFKSLTLITLVVLTFGGMLLGPLVQKYAFNEWWAGVPYGWDLTDNKTLIAFLAWFLAYVMNRKEESRGWVVFAAVLTIVVFSIPHSLYGSQLNQTTGKIIQGIIYSPSLIF